MQIAVNLPNDFVSFQSTADIEKDMRLSYSLWLFKNVRVTLAELAGVDIYDFMAACKQTGWPSLTSARKNCWKNWRECSRYDPSSRLFGIGCAIGLRQFKSTGKIVYLRCRAGNGLPGSHAP